MNYLSDRFEKRVDIGSILSRFPTRPGQKLPNGTTILKEVELRRYDHRRDSLVLCVQPDGAHRPFTSWVRTVACDIPQATGGFGVTDYCSWGDYYWGTLDEALAKFNLRVESKQELLDV